MGFFTGADKIPPLGFNKTPSLEFLDGCDKILPTASTCSITMRIPTCYKEYGCFKDAMNLALKGNDGFGGV